MQVNRLIFIGIFTLCILSCVEPFQPDINEEQDQLVIHGNISNEPGWYYVDISRSSPFNDPEFRAVENCEVRIEDGDGQKFNYAEYSPGRYRVELEEPFLGINKAYRIYVKTSDGEECMSEYDSLLACPAIDSLYYTLSSQEVEGSNNTYQKYQLYVDVKGKESDSRNFLWKVEETYEYHSQYQIEYIWNGSSITEVDPPEDSLYQCYNTQRIPDIYTTSTKYLTVNELRRYPLSYIRGSSRKLRLKYSFMVTQYSLSDEAFLYWERMKSLMGGDGGLYQKQPASSTGNIYNLTNAEEHVLGFFFASQKQKKWIFVKKIDNSYVDVDYPCSIDTTVNFFTLPVGSYLYKKNSKSPFGALESRCVDCRLQGGSLDPPYYWLTNE